MANRVSADQMRQMCEDAKKLGLRPERLMLLDQRLSEWSKDEITPSIAVKVLRHGQLAFQGAYGILGPDKEFDSLTVDSIFPVCSITKPVVATLLSILQEEGYLDLNDPVNQYIPEFTADPDSLVRIWHLLSHSSGIIDDDLYAHFNEFVTDKLELTIPQDGAPDDAWTELYIKIRSKMGLPDMEPGSEMHDDTFWRICLSAKPTHEPQKVMSYCNTGYQMAMNIIKKLSKKRIDDFAGEKIFKPLNMNDSHFIFPQEKIPRFVTRSKDFDGGDWLNHKVLDSESGSGGLKSTVHDMTRFGQMFLERGELDGKRILSEASVRSMTTDHNPTVPPAIFHNEKFDSWWGLGWNVSKGKKDCTGMLWSPLAFEHCGYCCTKLTCDPAYDIVTAFFTASKTDCFKYFPNFNNMIIGAIDDM